MQRSIDLTILRSCDLQIQRPSDFPILWSSDLQTHQSSYLLIYRPSILWGYRSNDPQMYLPRNLLIHQSSDLQTQGCSELHMYRSIDLPIHRSSDIQPLKKLCALFSLEKGKKQLFLHHPLHAMLCRCLRYVKKTTTPKHWRDGTGEGCGFLFLWSFLIWVQCQFCRQLHTRLTLGTCFTVISIPSIWSISIIFKAYRGKFLFPIWRYKRDLTSLSGYNLSCVYSNVPHAVDFNLALWEKYLKLHEHCYYVYLGLWG